MRVTQATLVQQTLDRLRLRLEQLQASQGQLASGKRIQRVSDDPGRMGSVLALRAMQRVREQQDRSAQDGATWVDLTDAKLRSAVEGLQRVRELAVRAASSGGAAERAAIAAEIVAIRDELVGIANARNGDQGLFAGTAAAPAVSLVGGVWSYTGDGTRVARRVADGEDVTVSLTADRVFGFSAGEDVFSMLDDLAARVSAGDPASVGSAIAGVDRALGRILDGLAEIGAAGRRIEQARARNASERDAILAQVSELEDVDLAQAIMELQLQEVAYQATLGAMARVLQPSLADFLR